MAYCIQQGMTVKIPNNLNLVRHNWDGTYTLINPDKIIGSLYPRMPFPKPKPPKHPSFWERLILAVVSVVVGMLVPELAGVLAEVMETVLAYFTAGTVLGAAGDLATQAIEDAFGDHHGIDLGEVFKTAAVSGLSAAFAYSMGKWLGKIQGIVKEEAYYESQNAFHQGMAMLFHLQHQFDWKSLELTALEVLGDHEFVIPVPANARWTVQLVDQFENSLLSSGLEAMLSMGIYGVPPEFAFAQMIGEIIGATAVEGVEDYTHDETALRELQQEKIGRAHV